MAASLCAAEGSLRIARRWDVQVLVQTARLCDLAAVNDLHKRCSREARRARYHGPRDGLRPAEWRRLTDPERGSTVLLRANNDRGRAIGFASLMHLPDSEAEIALLIEDRWQNLGIGTAVVNHLASIASSLSIQALAAWIEPGNARALRIMHGLGAKVDLTDGVAEARILLRSRVDSSV